MPAINWLHLTDLHQGMKGGWLWPTFREEFYRDLEQLHKKSGPWDMVLFTGDLAYSGKKEEYDDLNRFLDDLWTHLKNLGSNPILLPVPGNHDLIRPDSKLGTVRSFKLWHDDEELRDLFWESLDNEYRQTITKAFSSYMEWRQSSPAVPEAKLYKGIIPGDFSFSIEKEGLKTAIIGFNSSYLQLGGGNYEGLLDLDTRQLDGVRDDDAVKWIKDHHTALLLTHHPQSWLHPNSVREFKAEINPPGRFALHLFGHMHEPLSQSIRTGGSPTQRYLQGASLFGMETWGDGTKIRIHGYSAGRLSAEGDTGTLQIWPRKLEDMKAGHRKIIPHYELDLDTDDSIVESFRLSKPLIISEVIPTPPEETYTEKTQPLSIIEPPPSATKSYDLSNYVFFVPFDQKGDQVIGREKDLEKVRNLLADGPRTGIGHAVMIEGFGGLGKTQLAVEYAYDSKDAYNNGIIWINVDQDIETQLVDLVDKGGWIAPESEHKDKLAVARQRLSAYPNCLVILDNVESQDAISNLLQLLHHDTHVLATTRFELYGFEPIPLDPLNDNLSYKLLIQEARREPSEGPETSAALSIVKLLGGLPLAIELAGAYLRHRPTFDWEQYQRFLTNNLKEALPKKFLQNAYTKHKADLYSTLKINESLFEDEPRLRDILDLLTWSGPAPMGADLLCYLLNVEDITELLGALSLGTTLRLLNKPQNIDSYAIHRLVREVRREDIPLEGKEKWVASVCKAIGDWFKKMRNNFSDLSKYEAEIDHLKAWEHNARKFSPPYASRLMWLQAYPSFHQGRYLETQALLDAALVLYTDLGLQDADLKAHLLNDSGTIISLFGDPNTALKRHKESLELRQELHGERHEDVAASLSNVGNTLDHLGRYEEELVYAQRALALRQELFGEKHPDVATSLNNVGSALGRLGRYEEELSYAQRALAMYQELLGEKHPNVATSLNNVGGALGRLGRYEEELSHAQRALALRQELLGEKHPDVATSLSNVGSALGHLGRYNEEIVYAQRALAMYQELLGEKHPDVATSLNNVGNALGRVGRHEEELVYAQRALALSKDTYGKSHPITLRLTLNLAVSYFNKDDRKSAFDILNPLLHELPKNHILYSEAERLNQSILAKAVRPGFRQPPANPRKRKKKGKRK
ncbi:MAG TPA: tetratricopeptide repeat protein [Blastocatellia bacterium]|nr:tetratricopeptide repeat protein [Blastocatellia bacterium]